MKRRTTRKRRTLPPAPKPPATKTLSAWRSYMKKKREWASLCKQLKAISAPARKRLAVKKRKVRRAPKRATAPKRRKKTRRGWF